MAKSKTRAPEQTLEEVKYLKRLIDQRSLIRFKLTNNEVLEGIVEFYDDGFLRVTREGAPNLFVYKHDIKYLSEVG
jgi:host factor-I protein